MAVAAGGGALGMAAAMKWLTRARIRGRGKRHHSIDREHSLFYTLRWKPNTNDPPYYMVRWDEEAMEWQAVWAHALEDFKYHEGFSR